MTQGYTPLPTTENQAVTQSHQKTSSNALCLYLLLVLNLIVFIMLLQYNSAPQNIQVDIVNNRISQYIKESRIEKKQDKQNKKDSNKQNKEDSTDCVKNFEPFHELSNTLFFLPTKEIFENLSFHLDLFKRDYKTIKKTVFKNVSKIELKRYFYTLFLFYK